MLNGGYILLDLTKYNFLYDISSDDDLDDANELTKDEYNNIKKVFDTSLNNGKPIVVKTSGLYDHEYQKGVLFVGNIYNDGDTIAFGYDNFVDKTRRNIVLFKYGSKYYIASAPDLWMA